MRWKIIAVNATIVVLVAVLSFVLLMTSLRGVLADPAERMSELEQSLRAANAQLSLDALRLESWLDANSSSASVRGVFSPGSPAARNEAATAEANRLRDAAVGEPQFARMAPSVVLFVDADGTVIGRNGSALMRGDALAAAYPSLASSLKSGRTGSAVWINRQRQEQLLASFAPVRDDSGKVAGALVLGTPLNDERLNRTSDYTSGYPLLFETVGPGGPDVVAHSSKASSDLIKAGVSPGANTAASSALASRNVTKADGEFDGYVVGALPLEGYAEGNGVLLAAVPASMVESLSGLLWPVLGVGALGMVLVIFGGVLLGNYISQPVSELEDGLLAVINGNSDIRFQIEHDELGGLVFRINSLLNALMGVPEDTTDDQGRPSVAPSASSFQEALDVDESSVAMSNVDPAMAMALAREPGDSYYRRLFQEYVAAKRSLGDPVDNIGYEGFVARIRSSESELGRKHGRPVRYQIQVRNNAVVLLAVPLPETASA